MRLSGSPQTIILILARWIFPLLLCCGILVWVLKLWKADLTIPFCYAGDGICFQAFTKDVLDEGWYLHNHYLSFPGEMDMEDYPLSDNLSFLMMKLLGLATQSYGTVFNWFYLLTYPLATLTAFAVFRRFDVSYLPSLLGSLLFAFAPYHFMRGEPHIFLAAYFLVPLVVMVALWIYQGWKYTQPRPDGDAGKVAKSWRFEMVASIAICLAMGAAAVYYAFFGCFLLLLAGLWGAAYHRRPRLMGLALVFVAVVSLSVLVNILPTFLYGLQHGKNSESVIRYPSDAEYFGLKINNMVLPPPDYRLARYVQPSFTLGWNYGTYLGLVGSLGLIVLIGRLVVPFGRTSSTLMVSLAHMNFASLVLGTVGGFGFLLALFLAPWIRCYYRICIFISFFAVFAVVLLLEHLRTAYFEKTRLRWIFPLGVLGILFVGIWDQTNKFLVPPYDNTAAEYRSDRAFVHQIEALIPGQAVFQLPYAPFPEYGVLQMNCYDHMRGFLHTRSLRWSGGAVRGRSCEFWQRQICCQPVRKMLPSLALAGFKGVYVDRFGYADRAKQLEGDLKAILHEHPVVSENQRLVFYDLSDYARNLRASVGSTEWEARERQTMASLAVYPAWGVGFYHLEGPPEENWRWCGPKGKMEIRNIALEPRTILLEMSFEGRGPRLAQLSVHSSFFSETFQIALGKVCSFRKTLTLPPGRHVIEFECDGEKVTSEGDFRELVFRVRNCRVECLDSVNKELSIARHDPP